MAGCESDRVARSIAAADSLTRQIVVAAGTEYSSHE